MTRDTEIDPLDLHGQEAAASRKEVDERRRRQIAESDFKWLMNTKQGRRFMWDLLATTGADRVTTFCGDPLQSAFNEGEASVGRRYSLTAKTLCPEKFNLMLMEQKSDD